MTEDEMLAAYPDLERDDLQEALRYAADMLAEWCYRLPRWHQQQTDVCNPR